MTITVENTQSLSVSEQYALITDIQNVPTTVTIQDDGSEYVTYGVTPASEAAGAQLLAAFMPAIRAAARRTKLKGNEEEAEAVALEAFVRAVREYDLTSDTPFHHIVGNVMRNAVSRSDRDESTSLTIPEVQVARYHRLMHANGGDVRRAYEAASAGRDSAGGGLLSKDAFLTIHLALNSSSSLDAPSAAVHEAELEAPEATADTIVRREYVGWLLGQATRRQEQICRLAYGFTDHNTQRLRVLRGYRQDDVLEDMQVADCLDMSRSTVQRDRMKALATMRGAAEKSLATA
ncbi:hypothetical protein [Kribbella deserti]|uniref:Sigma-70 family RNA polymerase sigma factor n=1 Tax=Kribbella deserti TaxID=1926257 RepID=A0ABV6QGN6_9ACTN